MVLKKGVNFVPTLPLFPIPPPIPIPIFRYLQVITGFITILTGVYLLTVLGNMSQNDIYQYWPFAIDTFVNLMSNGIFIIYMNILSLPVFVGEMFSFEGYVEYTKGNLFCGISLFRNCRPIYSTAFAMVAMAVQRYVVVVKAFRANDILTFKYYTTIAAIVTFLTTVLIATSIGISIMRNNQEFYDCSGASFYGNRNLRMGIEGPVFYFIPGKKNMVFIDYKKMTLISQKST